MLNKRLLILFAGLLTLQLHAQDIHFTQYNMSPMTLNPANTGAFKGTLRIGGIYREQWRSVIKKSRFTTPSAWVDAPIIKGFRSKDWIGVGLMLISDKTGAGGLTTGGIRLGGAYHLGLDKKGNSQLTLGVNWGNTSRKIDFSKLLFEDGLVACNCSDFESGYKSADSKDFGNDPTRTLEKANFNDWQAGVLFTSKMNKKTDFNLGVSMFHLLRPNYSLLTKSGGGTVVGSSNQEIPRRLIVHGQLNTELSKRMTFNPTFMFQSMAGAKEIILQAMAGMKLNPEKDIIVHGGLGYRFGDAANLLVGMTKGNLRVGLAYDVNTSSLSTQSNYRGGWELAANYIIKIYKPAVVKPKIICPRY